MSSRESHSVSPWASDPSVILIDPPAWPAYGTTWSHLVSDTSLEELHAFARSVGLPARAFDHDHYDVPSDRYDALVAAGARPVAARELLAALRESGLRVAARDKARVGPARRLQELTQRWSRLPAQLPWDVPAEAWSSAGTDLLDRWSEPHRHYHTTAHLLDVLHALELLAQEQHDGGPAAVMAAWFHDAVYAGRPGSDEADSADLAIGTLSALGARRPLTERVGELVLGTATPGDPDGADAAVLNDADLAVLAGTPQRYQRYAAAIRAEYAHVGDEDFRSGRLAVLERLLGLPALYHTTSARRRWEARARDNLERERRQWLRGERG